MSKKNHNNDDIVIATATVRENRLPLFQPSKRPQERKVEIVTVHGKVKVEGKLGQPHKDLLEVIKDSSLDWGYTEDGRLAVLVDPYTIRKKLSPCQYSYTTLSNLFKDLMRTIITIETKEYKAMGTFLADVKFSNREVTYRKNPDPKNPDKKRKLLKVEFGTLGTKLIEQDLSIFYDPIPIVRLRYGISKAVTRHILSHSVQPRGGWKIDTVIKAVAGEISNDLMRQMRRKIRHDAKKLLECGILLENDRLSLTNGKADTGGVTPSPASVTPSPASVTPSPAF